MFQELNNRKRLEERITELKECVVEKSRELENERGNNLELINKLSEVNWELETAMGQLEREKERARELKSVMERRRDELE